MLTLFSLQGQGTSSRRSSSSWWKCQVSCPKSSQNAHIATPSHIKQPLRHISSTSPAPHANTTLSSGPRDRHPPQQQQLVGRARKPRLLPPRSHRLLLLSNPRLPPSKAPLSSIPPPATAPRVRLPQPQPPAPSRSAPARLLVMPLLLRRRLLPKQTARRAPRLLPTTKSVLWS